MIELLTKFGRLLFVFVKTFMTLAIIFIDLCEYCLKNSPCMPPGPTVLCDDKDLITQSTSSWLMILSKGPACGSVVLHLLLFAMRSIIPHDRGLSCSSSIARDKCFPVLYMCILYRFWMSSVTVPYAISFRSIIVRLRNEQGSLKNTRNNLSKQAKRQINMSCFIFEFFLSLLFYF